MKGLLCCSDRNKCGSGKAIFAHSRGCWRGRLEIWRGGRKWQVHEKDSHPDLVCNKQVKGLRSLVALECYTSGQCL